MPIRESEKRRYPPDWPAISLAIKERAGWRCECLGECGRGTHEGRCPNVHGQPAYGTGSNVVLTTAHLDHTPENCDPDNLRAMCQGCHLHYDRDHHAQTRQATRAAELAAQMEPLFDLPENTMTEPETPAALLRRAAKQMREQAEAAMILTEDGRGQWFPWGTVANTKWREFPEPREVPGAPYPFGDGGTEMADGQYEPTGDAFVTHAVYEHDQEEDWHSPHFFAGPMPEAIAVHIASWHPMVALAVADLLDESAAYYESLSPLEAAFVAEATGGDNDPGLKIARAYLNERTDSTDSPGQVEGPGSGAGAHGAEVPLADVRAAGPSQVEGLADGPARNDQERPGR